MDAFRRGSMRVADDISLIIQNAGKTFGFLDDGRDLVAVTGDKDGRVATFPDHSDEGWPEVRVVLPAGAEFIYAANGPLSRVAIWSVGRVESEVLEELSSNPDAPRFEPRARGGVTATLGGNVTIKIRGVKAKSTVLSMRQVREPESIVEVLQNRATR